jgi:hypothetical protein
MEIDRLRKFTGQVAQIRAQTDSGTWRILLHGRFDVRSEG